MSGSANIAAGSGQRQNNPVSAVVVTGADGDKPIRLLVNNMLKTKIFHLSRDPKVFPLLRRGKSFGSGQELVDEPSCQVIATALLETVYSDPGGLEPAGGPTRAELLATKLSTFNWKTKAQQLAILNALWAKCYEGFAPDTDAEAMCDTNANFSFGGGQLTSSLRPINRDLPLVGLQRGPKAQAWAAYTVGFRTEGGKGSAGSTRNDLVRVTSEGLKPLCTNTPLALRIAGKAYTGLDVAKGVRIYCGYQNRDVYNESGTCVSRTLLGATAFPYRHTISVEDGLDYHYLFALRCAGLRGLDTEQWQLDRDASWRPGEKAFLNIPADRIIGYTRTRRHGAGKGWKLEFVDCAWTWINEPPLEVKQYLIAELAAWTPGIVYEIRTQYDFTFN